MEQFFLDLTLRLGFPIVVIIAMVKGYLVPGFVYDRLVKDNERMVHVLEEKVLPALIQSNEVLTNVVPILKEHEQEESTRSSNVRNTPPRRGK